MRVTDDFQDILGLLERSGARSLIMGGYAVAFHARTRYTRDLDIMVDASPENRERVNQAGVANGHRRDQSADESYFLTEN